MVQDALVTIRFSTSRATLCGVHVSGVDYEVTPAFARQVVDREQVAEYVEGASAAVPMLLAKERKKK